MKAAIWASNKAGMELKNKGPKLFWLIHTQQAEDSFTVILFGGEEEISRVEELSQPSRIFSTAKSTIMEMLYSS